MIGGGWLLGIIFRFCWRGGAGRTSRSVVRWKFDLIFFLAGAEFEDLPEHAGCHRRNRIDAKHRRAGRTDDFIGDTYQALVAASTEEDAQNRELAEYVVEPVHRNEGTAHTHLTAGIIDTAFDGGA